MSGLTLVTNEPGFHPLKTKEDYRLFFHTLALVFAPIAILLGYATDTSWSFWSGLVLGLVDALFSLVLTPDSIRKVLYALSALVTAVMIFLNLGDPQQLTLLIGAISSALGSVIAVFYTNGSTAIPILPATVPKAA